MLAVEGVDCAAVGVVRSGSLIALGASDRVALLLSEEQVRTGLGPLPDAIAFAQPTELGELPEQWAVTSLGVLAHGHGVVALAAYPVIAEGQVAGVVACFGYRQGVPGSGVVGALERVASVLSPPQQFAAEASTVELAAEALGRTRGVSLIEALVLLRGRARSSGAALEDVALGVLDGSLVLDPTGG